MARLIGADQPESEATIRTNKIYAANAYNNYTRELTFSPSDISSLHLWYKSDSISGLSHNDTVSTWADSSSNGFDATQATTSLKPTYKSSSDTLNGYPSVYFDGVDDYLDIDMSTNTTSNRATTVFAIYLPHASYANQGYLMAATTATSTNGQRSFYISTRSPGRSTSNLGYGVGCSMAVGNGSFANTKQAYIPFGLPDAYTWDTTSSIGLKNGVIILGGTVHDGPQSYDEYFMSVNGFSGAMGNGYLVNYARTLTAFRMGAAQSQSWNEFRGYLIEVIVYDASVIGDDHDKVVGYLAWKYGSEDYLVNNHPYKLGPP